MHRLTLLHPLLFFLLSFSHLQAVSAENRPVSLLLLDSAGSEASGLLVVGERGTMLKSKDKGKSWRSTQLSAEVLLTAVAVQGSEWWAVGHDATILRGSFDSEKDTIEYSAPEREQAFFDILFTDTLHGFAVGAYGLMMKTADGGKTWQDISRIKDDRHLYAILLLKNGNLLIAGEAGLLLRSSNRGATWESLQAPSGFQGSFFGLLELIGGKLFLFGMRGALFVSVDHGGHFKKIDTGITDGLQGGCADMQGGAFFVGRSGLVLHIDAEKKVNFTRLRKLGSLSAIRRLSTGNYLLFGEKGVSSPLSLNSLLTSTPTEHE